MALVGNAVPGEMDEKCSKSNELAVCRRSVECQRSHRFVQMIGNFDRRRRMFKYGGGVKQGDSVCVCDASAHSIAITIITTISDASAKRLLSE